MMKIVCPFSFQNSPHFSIKSLTKLTAHGPKSKNLPKRSSARNRCTWLSSTCNKNIYRKTPSISRISSISRTPTFEFWAGHQSPDYEILKTSRIGRTLTLATPTDSPAGQPAGVVNRPILRAHNEPATCGRQTSNRSMTPRTQWGSYANIDNKDKCQGNNSFSFP